MNIIKEIKKLQKCCCGKAIKIERGYPTPAEAQSDPTLNVGELYYLTGEIPGTETNSVYIKT